MAVASVVIVDWSAAAAPKTGADSVWFAQVRAGAHDPERLENPATRAEAMIALADLAADEVDAGRSLLIGFDFPFGYPAGAAAAFIGADRSPGEALWAAVWRRLAAEIQDGPRNRNNRFDVAERFNADAFDGRGPFWGCPPTQTRAALPHRKPDGYGERYPAERRIVERRVRSTQPTWKLFTTGSVGGQTLVGVAALERFRRDQRLRDHVAVWPFETDLALSDAPVVLAEVYPSLRPPDPSYAVKDAGQVVGIARRLAQLAADERLAPLFGGATDLTAEERAVVTTEEAWILGVGDSSLLIEDAL